MNRLRYAAIRALDWIDDRLGHRWYWLCHRINMSPWWDLEPGSRREGGRR